MGCLCAGWRPLLPHRDQWSQLYALVLDGVTFSRAELAKRGVGTTGGGGYDSVPDAEPARKAEGGRVAGGEAEAVGVGEGEGGSDGSEDGIVE